MAASEDYIYVSDVANARIVRVRMDYELDNIPGLTDRNSAAEKATGATGLVLDAAPNPFNPSTTIRYALPSPAHVRLTVYDMLGREVATLVNEKQTPGWKEVTWNAANFSSGMYMLRMECGSFIETKKMVLMI